MKHLELSLLLLAAVVLIDVDPVSAQLRSAPANSPTGRTTSASVAKIDSNTRAKSTAPAGSRVVREGVGVDGIVVGKSTSKDVIKRYGGVYRWEVNKKYSYQMTYDSLGLSFYFCQTDKTEEIFLIEMKAPFKGRTAKGVMIGKTTKEETIKLYGPPSDGFEYPGIHFYYNRYGNRNLITGIDIVERSGLRQCVEKK